MKDVTDSFFDAEQPGLAAKPRAPKRVYLMPPVRWKSGRASLLLQDTDWSSVVQAPCSWSPKWVKPSPLPTPSARSRRLEWAAIGPHATYVVPSLHYLADWPPAPASPDGEPSEDDLQDFALDASPAAPRWDFAHPRNILAAVSCCAVFSVIAIPLLTGVAHSEPKIDPLSTVDEAHRAHGAGALPTTLAHGHAWVRFREPGQSLPVMPAISESSLVKNIGAPALAGNAMGSSDTATVPTVAADTGPPGAFSSVQSVVRSQQVSALAALVTPAPSMEPVKLAPLPISIEMPPPASIQPLAEYILPVLYEIPTSTLPSRRLHSVVAMTLISDVSTMDLMMPIAEPDLDIKSSDSVWAQVGKQFDIDPLLLYSVALVESKSLHPNGQVAPTPWLFRVNDHLVTGERHHVQMQIATAGQLNSAVQDVGIMQVYYPMHRNAARDPLTLLDPRTNITVGAKILKDGMHQTRDAVLGVGYYHSHTPSLALNYGTAVMIVYQRLKGVYRRGRHVPVGVAPVARPPLRLATGFNGRPSRTLSARARVLAGQCLFL